MLRIQNLSNILKLLISLLQLFWIIDKNVSISNLYPSHCKFSIPFEKLSMYRYPSQFLFLLHTIIVISVKHRPVYINKLEIFVHIANDICIRFVLNFRKERIDNIKGCARCTDLSIYQNTSVSACAHGAKSTCMLWCHIYGIQLDAKLVI